MDCPTCNKSYKNKNSLYCHLRYECNKPNTFKCLFCNYTSKRKNNLKIHCMARHQDDMKNHRFDHHKFFPCSRCGKQYRSKKAMLTHFRYSCENKRQFFCTVCPAAYFYSHHLKRHIQHQHQQVLA